ncbi:MAG: hypothetical protein IPQ18_14750 [Saprospiraceae bacterium]|nr:hypothetical protein [Saprospiraceae bacterium]
MCFPFEKYLENTLGPLVNPKERGVFQEQIDGNDEKPRERNQGFSYLKIR